MLNSSTACFWMKQVFHNKGSTVDQHGARQTTAAFENFYEYTATGMEKFPVPDEQPVYLAARLDGLASARLLHAPVSLTSRFPVTVLELDIERVEVDRLLREMIALQEELDWQCYRLYNITEDELTYRDAAGEPATPPELRLGERAFEIVLARRMAAGEEETTWFQRHGSTPITELPAHWPADYRALVERRMERIQQDRYVGLVERPEYKRRWNTEPWEAQATRALQEWLKTRLEDPAYWPQPRLQTTRTLADRAQRDPDFMAVAELHRGHAGFDVHALVRELVEAETVPFLPVLRYKLAGLRKREVWERTWELQRQEDAIDAQVAAQLRREAGESEAQHATRVAAEQKRRKQEEVGDIARPPKYTSADFASPVFWRHRGALDVPKERFIGYPFCSRENDPSPLVGWAGWNHLEQAQALGEWINEVQQQEGWGPPRLTPLLAGMAELIPWLKQWHAEPVPGYGRMDQFFETFLDTKLHEHDLTPRDLREWTPPAAPRGRRRAGAA
ncbi:MAG: system adenine-specific DNA-methyltransferase PglX [Gemmatimonadetes bacterium]|nr:system adenine-specific DNA-methyltransferase PglX [Gemmatimonadota bacterium]